MRSKLAVELHDRALQLLEERRLEEARGCCERSLRILNENKGEDSPDVANVSNTLAAISEQCADWRLELEHSLRAVPIMDELGSHVERPEADLILIEALARAGDSLRQLGEYGKAEPFLQRAIEASERAYGRHDPAVAKALNNLAVLYKYSGEFEAAE
jgi:tetratricopeptide (TPR) repeat protein